MIDVSQKKIIVSKLSPYLPKKLGVFGSYARGESHPGSDLDLLVEFEKKINLLDLIGLEQELSEALGIKVDLVSEKAISPYIKSSIEKDFKSLI